LLSAGQDAVRRPNQAGNTPIHACCLRGQLRMLECLLDHRSVPELPDAVWRAQLHFQLQALNKGGHSPLHLALLHNHARYHGLLMID